MQLPKNNDKLEWDGDAYPDVGVTRFGIKQNSICGTDIHIYKAE